MSDAAMQRRLKRFAWLAFAAWKFPKTGARFAFRPALYPVAVADFATCNQTCHHHN
jgi:hypothetical protein